jgi:ribosomal protein S18 acetylase RimI-like enzyme
MPLDQLDSCLRWSLDAYSPGRAGWVVRRLTDKVRRGDLSSIIAAATLSGETLSAGNRGAADIADRVIHGVGIAIDQGGGAATMLVLRTDPQTPPGDVVAPLAARLREAGVTFLQASSDDDSQAAALSAAGFRPLADLDLMVLDRRDYDEAARLAARPETARPGAAASRSAQDSGSGQPPADWVRPQWLGDDWRATFVDVTCQTFTGTLDCPRLSDYRSDADVAGGYLAAPGFDPSLCRLLRVGGEIAGCLVLTRHAAGGADPATDQDTAAGLASDSGDLELTYMGLVPRFRGRGLGAAMLAETVEVAREISAAQVVLAVDHENRPANTIYRRMGWRVVERESVWGFKI